MSERIINSSLELAIMGLLWQQPHSGYDLLKVFSENDVRILGWMRLFILLTANRLL